MNTKSIRIHLNNVIVKLIVKSIGLGTKKFSDNMNDCVLDNLAVASWFLQILLDQRGFGQLESPRLLLQPCAHHQMDTWPKTGPLKVHCVFVW